jgi:hypothetical protein
LRILTTLERNAIIRTQLEGEKTMKGSLRIKILVLTLSLLLGSLAVTATERAFSANGRGVATFVTDGAGNVIGADVTGSGTGTHLGAFTNAGRIFFAPDPNDPTRLLVTGAAAFTAANGDKLNIVVEDGEQDVATFIGRGKFRFTGGTGRFANATGVVSYVVEQNLVTGGYEITVVGSIDY